jgi:acyl carrier protein
MSVDLVDRVAEIAADVFGEDAGAVGADTTPDDLESWDSLAQLNLVVALEDEFGIELLPKDIDAMVSIEAIAALVRSRIT